MFSIILLMEEILHHPKALSPRNCSSLGALGGARFHPSTVLALTSYTPPPFTPLFELPELARQLVR